MIDPIESQRGHLAALLKKEQALNKKKMDIESELQRVAAMVTENYSILRSMIKKEWHS